MSTFLPYGTFNPVAKKRDQSKLSDRLPNSLFDQMKELIKRSMETDVLEGTGPYKGIVLRVDDPQGEGSGSNYLLRYFKEVVGQMPTVISMKVRIPELHAHYPEPEQFNSEEGDHQAIINLYPTFYYIGYDSPTFSPEDIVSCDFLDKKNFTGGIVHKLDPMFSTPIREASIIEAFQPAPPMLSESAAGDSMSVGDQPGSIAPTEQKVSNTDPESDIKHSDRVYIEQDYRYPIPFSGGGKISNGSVGPANQADAFATANVTATKQKEKLGTNINFQQTSKSMIIYNSSLGKAKFMRTPTAATRRARKAGITCVFIEAVWQGPPEGDLQSPEQRTYEFNRLRDYARAFSKQGISVYIWGRVNVSMAKEFCNYAFMIAKRVGAIGVAINPDVSYVKAADGKKHADFISKMVKSKAKEFNLLSAVYLPWFAKWAMLDGDINKPFDYYIRFPYESFYGFDLYLIDCKWDDRYKQFTGLDADQWLTSNPITGEVSAKLIPNDGNGHWFCGEYKEMLSNNWDMDDTTIEKESYPIANNALNPQNDPNGEYGDRYTIHVNYSHYGSLNADGSVSLGEKKKRRGLHARLNQGELDAVGYYTPRRTYIPVLSIDGAGFFANFAGESVSMTCRGNGIKSPRFFERECKEMFMLNNVDNSDVSLVSSVCISSWAATGRHQRHFTKTRWQVVEEMVVPDKDSFYMQDHPVVESANGSYAGNLIDWNGPPVETTGYQDPDYYLRLDPNNSKTLVDIPKFGIETFNMTNKPAILLKNRLAPLDTDENNYITSDVDLCAVIKSDPVFNGKSLLTGQTIGKSTQCPRVLPAVNAATTPGNNPASALSTLGAAMIRNSDDPFDYSSIRSSAISWGFDPGVELNAKIVDYMNKLADKVYRSLPLHHPAFKNQHHDRLWVTKGKKSVVKQVIIMFNKFTGKSSGANVSNTVFNSIYPQPWAQEIKSIFKAGLQSGQNHVSILESAAWKLGQRISEGKVSLPHLTDDSVDIHTTSVHAAMGEMNPYAMTTSQMHKTKFVRIIKQAAAEIGTNKVDVEDYEQHVHIKI